MRTAWMRPLGALVGGALLISAAACSEDETAEVTIEYEQLANFPCYNVPSSSGTGCAPQSDDMRMYVMFHITRIANTGSGAKDYTFDRKPISTAGGDEFLLNEIPSHEGALLGVKLLPSKIEVDAGDTRTNDLGCIILEADIDDEIDFADWNIIHTSGIKVDLFHQIDSEQPVRMNREAGNDEFFGTDYANSEDLQAKCA